MSWIRENTLNWVQLVAAKALARLGPIPKHVAIIMDGNRRYTEKKGVEKVQGHNKGFEKLTETLQWFRALGITEITVYAFSIENFKRSEEEVNCLMELARRKFQKLLDDSNQLMRDGVRVRVIGNLSLLPDDVRKLIAEAMVITKDNDRTILNIAFAYTSRDEITNAVKEVVRGIEKADITPEDISEELISECLYTNVSPEPDLLIRTSGEVRFSDFLLWQTSCSCIYFTKVLWPEFGGWDLLAAIFYYQSCYADLEFVKEQEKTEPLVVNNDNNRVINFVNGLKRDRDITLEKMCLGNA